MLVPSMLNMADVMADSGYTEEQVFDLGISSAIVFLVVVPLMGACRVPPEALSHFMAGDDDYTAEGMPVHYSGALSGRWTIKRERLRILPATWGKWVTDVEDIQALCERQAEDATPSAAPVVTDQTKTLKPASDGPAIPKNQRPDLLTPLIEKAQRGETDLFSPAVIWPKLCDMAECKTTPFIGKTESGLQWIDANDSPQFLTKDALGDRLRRQKKAAIERGKPR